MDRNKDSETYGCLCRPFWHDKTTDFPSAHQQIGVLPLAIVYGNQLGENSYYQDENIQEWCSAGIEYWKKIQRKNGSFDEHYPREHSLGATAWSLWAVTEAISHLDNPPEISQTVQKAVNFISSYDEPGTIANHQAVTASALFNASHIVDIPQELITKRINKVQELQSNEGWFQEYEGGDPGYQSTAIAHLARIWKEEPDLVDENMLKDAVDFFESFIDENNYYGANIGSRSTQHVHPTGFEIFAEESEKAAKVAYALRKHSSEKNILNPTAVDDKHFSWHLAEFLESYLNISKAEEEIREIQDRRYQDFVIRNKGDDKMFLNISKGGYFKHYRNGELINEDQGITTRINGNTFTSNWMDTTSEVDIRNSTIEINGLLHPIPSNSLNWWKFIGLRVFQHSIGRIPRVSLFMKDNLIDRLITGKGSNHEFKRIVDLENSDTMNYFEGEEMRGKSRSMFIPNSEYFLN